MKISGTVISIAPILVPVNISTSSINALNKRKQARDAEPTEYPFVLAFVTFPTASSQSVILLTSSSSYDISTIPPALSAIGPNPDIERTYTPVANIPIVAIAVPKSPPIFYPCSFTKPAFSPR